MLTGDRWWSPGGDRIHGHWPGLSVGKVAPVPGLVAERPLTKPRVIDLWLCLLQEGAAAIRITLDRLVVACCTPST